MKETLESRIANAKNLLDVLLILKESTMRDTHVSTLAYVKENILEFNGTYSVWSCSPFPLVNGQKEYMLHAYCFSDMGFEINSIVPILFTDFNFINNLNSVDKTPKPTDDTGLHLIKYGIILNQINSNSEISGLVRYDKNQNLNETQKSRARNNIGAGTYSKPESGIPASDLQAGVIPTDVAKTNIDNLFSKTQTIYGNDDTPLNLRANHATWSNIALFNSSGTRLGNIGANGNNPYWWGGQGNNGQIALTNDIQQAFTPVAIGSTTTSFLGQGYNGASFNIGNTDYAGIYLFTYGNCMVAIPIANIQSNTEYKIAATLVNFYGSYEVKVLTYLYNNGFLYIYQKQNFIPTGYTAYLFKVKLYT